MTAPCRRDAQPIERGRNEGSGVTDETPEAGGTVASLIGRWFVAPSVLDVELPASHCPGTATAIRLVRCCGGVIAAPPYTPSRRGICSKFLKRGCTEQWAYQA